MIEPFRIAIVGGGIGGLFAALSIQHHNPTADIKIDIYEQASEYTEIGAGVGIGPNASKLIRKLGLLDESYKIAGKRDGVWFSFRRYDTGEEVVDVPSSEDPTMPQLPMHRAEFLDVLKQAVQRRGAATLHTKKKCQQLQENGSTMTVRFMDGTETAAHLVIGADGIHSAVRSHYVNDEAQYGGMVVYRGLCPISSPEGKWPLSTYATNWVAPGKHLLTFPISDNKTLNVVGFVSTPIQQLGDAAESWKLAGDKATIQEEFKGFAGPVQT